MPSSHKSAGRLDSQQIELVGRAHLETRLLQAGFEVARPIRDKGVDLIAYSDVQGGQFFAAPIQLKAATGMIFSIERKYEGRGIIYAYLWNVLQNPRLFLVPYDEAVLLLPESSSRTESWMTKGGWYTGKPSAELRMRLEPFENCFEALNPWATQRWREKTGFAPGVPDLPLAPGQPPVSRGA